MLDGSTATTADLNKLAAVTSSAAELNLLDGVTASTSEINKLTGVTASTAQLNMLAGVTAGTAAASKVVTVSSDGATADLSGAKLVGAGQLKVNNATSHGDGSWLVSNWENTPALVQCRGNTAGTLHNQSTLSGTAHEDVVQQHDHDGGWAGYAGIPTEGPHTNCSSDARAPHTPRASRSQAATLRTPARCAGRRSISATSGAICGHA